MCIKSDEEYDKMLAKLPDEPCGLIDFKRGEFYSLVQWETIKGHMESKELIDHPACQIFHTYFEPHTEIGWHTHGQNVVETVTCLEGEITILLANKKSVTLRTNDKIEISANMAHMAFTGDKPTQIVAMTVPKEVKQEKGGR